MNSSGIKIINIKAATLYEHNLGIRDWYDYTNGVLSNSLFSTHLISLGMKISKNQSTRDLICLDFGFGSCSYEEKREHLIDLKDKSDYSEKTKNIEKLLDVLEDNKFKYCKKSKEEIRDLFYQNGVPITYFKKDKLGNVISQETIQYKMLYRNSSKAKIGQVMFINEKLYNKAYGWLTMGLGKRMPCDDAKIVELSAYAPLTTSTVIDTLNIPAEDILILEDKDSMFRTLANVVRAKDCDACERVIDEQKTEKARLTAISKGKVDLYGNPIYKKVYKKVNCLKKKCVVTQEEIEVKNTVWDGLGIIDDTYFPDYANGMMLLRHHFFKMCGFRGKIQDFFRDWCRKKGYDYDTYTVRDMFGVSHKLKDVKIVTTDNAIKWKKFIDLMGDTPLKAYQYWLKKVNTDGSCFGIVKTDHQSKLGDVQQMSYQMINTLPCSKDDVKSIAQTSIDYVELLKSNPNEFEQFLRKNANEVNHYEMMADLYNHNHDFANSKWFRQEKRKIISSYVHKLRSGKITVNGDNLTICSNPYALLLYAVGDDWENDPTLSYEPGAIQCYTPRFHDGEYLCAFRSPHNSPNNICYLHNHYSPEMERYFPLSNNIIIVNCIGTDIQDRGNGLDHDSDFFFVTNHGTFVNYAKICYEKYPTIVNELKESGITYKNTPIEYARMDNKLALSKRGIGESSNMAQIALTYYWTLPSQDLYDNVIILSVLAQVIIDGCKREYEVDAISEIERIRNMPCMHLAEGKGDFPLFMKYTKDIKTTKNGSAIPYENIAGERKKLHERINQNLICPMNWLQEWLDKIQGSSQERTTPTEEFFIKATGTGNRNQMSRIRKLVEEYNDFLAINHDQLHNEDFAFEFNEVTETFYNNIRKIKINNAVTINRLVETALGLDKENNNPQVKKHMGSTYKRKILNTLYRSNRDFFLNCFKK